MLMFGEPHVPKLVHSLCLLIVTGRKATKLDKILFVDLIMRAVIKKDDFIFKLNINDPDIAGNREGTSTLQITSQAMIIERCLTLSDNEHIDTHFILLAQFFVFVYTFGVALNKRMM